MLIPVLCQSQTERLKYRQIDNKVMIISKYPGSEGQTLGSPWKGLLYLKLYKLKVPIYPVFIGKVMASLRSLRAGIR